MKVFGYLEYDYSINEEYVMMLKFSMNLNY